MLIAFKDLLTLSTFMVFQDYITETSCINKYRPQVMCYGKCVLIDQIEKSNEEDSPIQQYDTSKKINYIAEKAHYSLKNNTITHLPIPESVPSMHGIDFRNETFHPPQG